MYGLCRSVASWKRCFVCGLYLLCLFGSSQGLAADLAVDYWVDGMKKTGTLQTINSVSGNTALATIKTQDGLVRQASYNVKVPALRSAFTSVARGIRPSPSSVLTAVVAGYMAYAAWEILNEELKRPVDTATGYATCPSNYVQNPDSSGTNRSTWVPIPCVRYSSPREIHLENGVDDPTKVIPWTTTSTQTVERYICRENALPPACVSRYATITIYRSTNTTIPARDDGTLTDEGFYSKLSEKPTDLATLLGALGGEVLDPTGSVDPEKPDFCDDLEPVIDPDTGEEVPPEGCTEENVFREIGQSFDLSALFKEQIEKAETSGWLPRECPAPVVLGADSQLIPQFTFSYESICSLAGIISTFVLLIGFFSAFMILYHALLAGD